MRERKIYGYRWRHNADWRVEYEAYAYHKGGRRQHWLGLTPAALATLVRHLDHNGYLAEYAETPPAWAA